MHGEDGHVDREEGGATRVPQGRPARRGVRASVQGGAMRAFLGGASVRLMSNATPLPSSAPSKRSERFTSNRMGAAALHVEDITTYDPPPPPHHASSNVSVSDIPSSPAEVREPALTQPGLSRASRRRKNGNWTNEELVEAVAAYDNGMRMKKASEKFRIPYSSFREHCYGLRK
jgi:hypothetical protein